MLAERTKILLVEDNPDDARLLARALSAARAPLVDLVQVDRLSAGLTILAAGGVDVVLLDLGLPDAAGTGTVARVHAAAPEVPIVVLTGFDDEATGAAAIRHGAQDYLVKGRVDSAHLLHAIYYAIVRRRAESDARRIYREQAARAEAEAAAARSRLLAEVSRVLASSFDWAATLSAAARLVVPALSDGCLIDLIEDSGEIRRVATVHADPAVAEAMEQRALLSRSAAPDWLTVPLLARGKTLGTISLFRGGHPRTFSPEDMAFAEDLASRAALAVENARLYRAREDVIAIVSHDLRNPLNVISLCAASLRRDPLPFADRTRHVVTIERSIARMNGLIAGVLEMTRIDAGRVLLERGHIAPDALLRDADELFRALAEEKSITFELQVAEGLPLVYADRERTLQVFSNLIGNAVKFTPQGGAVILCAAPGEGEVQFCVSDTGPGIRAEDQGRVFDRFWQGEQESRRGAGLGLSIAKALVVAHGGRIWVESGARQGSAFCFTLPVNAT